jgi:arylsulfatase
VVGLACGSDSPAPTSPAEVINVVWIVLDALRADHLSAYGYERPTSPAIDALAARGVLFENHWAQAPNTIWSVPSYMTGRFEPVFYQDPRHLDLWFLRDPPAGEVLVSEIFRGSGYATAMFSASPWYSAESRLARSFDRFGWLAHAEGSDPRDRATNPELYQWLEAHASAPFFLYVHSLTTHEPRFASNTEDTWLDPDFPAGRDRQLRSRWTRAATPFDADDQAHLRNLYDGGIRVADRFVSEIEAKIQELGIAERTIFVVSSDHGEALGQDGKTVGHPAQAFYDDVLRVPLVIAGPGVLAGRRIGSITQNVDIVPMLVELTNLPTKARFQGVSLSRILEVDGAPHDYAFARLPRRFLTAAHDRVLVYRDRKFAVRGHPTASPEQLQVTSWAMPDRIGARRAAPEDEARRATVLREVREILGPLWQTTRAQPRRAPPVFEAAHRLKMHRKSVVLEEADPRDGRWTLQKLPPRAGGPDTLLARGRVLVGHPASEVLPELDLSLEIPDGTYEVDIAAVGVPGSTEVVSFRFRAEAEPEFREWTVEPGEQEERRWIRLGTYPVQDSVFRYTLAPGTPSNPTAIGKLRFRKAGQDGGALPADAAREAELRRLRSLGYVE